MLFAFIHWTHPIQLELGTEHLHCQEDRTTAAHRPVAQRLQSQPTILLAPSCLFPPVLATVSPPKPAESQEQCVLCSEVLHSLTPCSHGSVHPPHLDGLGYVHFVYLNLGKAAPRHIFILLVIAIKQVSGIYSHTNCSLRDDKWNRHLALANIWRTQNKWLNHPWVWLHFCAAFHCSAITFATLKCIS